MAVDTFMAYVGVYPSVDAAEADYQLVKDLHTAAGLIDSCVVTGRRRLLEAGTATGCR